MKYISQPIIKKDAYALLSGKPVYTDNLTPADCPIVRLLHSPRVHARIKSINTGVAKRILGVETIFTYKDVLASRFALAGQTYPKSSPYDCLTLDEVVRYAGDEVAITAAKSEANALQATGLIHVEYEVYDVVLGFIKALDHPVIVHAKEGYKLLHEIGSERLHNLRSYDESIVGDVDQAFAECDAVLEREYHTKANAQAMMKVFHSYAYMDTFDRLNMVSSTQVPFYIRRMVANALELPKPQIKVIRPRIDGGSGAKQTSYTGIFTAFVIWKLRKLYRLVYAREETSMASNFRHEIKTRVKIGAMKNGEVRTINLYTPSSTGAYGECGSMTVGLSGHKSLPICNRVKANYSISNVVYTDTITADAYHGYGVTQGQSVVESAVDELANILHTDPCGLCSRNMVQEDKVMKQYCGEHLNSCTPDRCLRKAVDMIGRKEKVLCCDTGDKVRGLGVALSMQGSGITNVSIVSAVIKLQDDGLYTLSIGTTDMGTECDTISTQMVAECLNCGMDSIIIQSVDTDASPYSIGPYASVTTYVAGATVVKTCEKLKKQILHGAVVLLDVEEEHIIFDGNMLRAVEDDREIILVEFANRCFVDGKGACLIANAPHCSPTPPLPFMAETAGVDVDKLTNEIMLVDYVAIVDCGTIINPNLAGIQAEGGIAQGIGMALCRDITYSCKGRVRNNSFLQYKIPSWQDVGTIRVDFESSYEGDGPFGAKSTGEVVISTPASTIASTVAHANGVQVRTLPTTAEKILLEKDED